MGDTKIEWTDKVLNPVTGCTKVSEGCRNCYAEREFHRPYPGQEFTEVKLHPDRLDAPLHWRKPARIFVNSMGDLFHDDVPDWMIDEVFTVMAKCARHTFQILTKRPERMLRYLSRLEDAADEHAPKTVEKSFTPSQVLNLRHLARHPYNHAAFSAPWPLPNAWLGVSVESPNHKERIDELRQVPAATRWVSFEPLIADVGKLDLTGISWVVVGGETGPHARPLNTAWATSIRDQCQAADVPFFFKQWGEWLGAEQDGNPNHVPEILNASYESQRVGKRAAGRLLDGRTWDESPARST